MKFYHYRLPQTTSATLWDVKNAEQKSSDLFQRGGKSRSSAVLIRAELTGSVYSYPLFRSESSQYFPAHLRSGSHWALGLL